jgi:acyl carrier protein
MGQLLSPDGRQLTGDVPVRPKTAAPERGGVGEEAAHDGSGEAVDPDIHSTLVSVVRRLRPLVPADEVTAEARFHADLGIDSLGLISLITELEEALGFEFEDYVALAQIGTVGGLVSATQAALGAVR